jgi:2-keto-3-deoxygluconate permease
VLINSFAPEALKIGGFTQALFKDGALALIGLLIFATGAQITGSHSGKAAAATTGVVLVCKTLIPASIAIALGLLVGVEGFLGISILALSRSWGTATARCGWPSPASTATNATPAPMSPAPSTTARSSP